MKTFSGHVRDWTGTELENCVVVCYAGKMGGAASWQCKCTCGQEFVVRADRLATNKVKSCRKCGYKNKGQKQVKDLIGKTWDTGTVVEKYLGKENGKHYWQLKCGCGVIYKCKADSINHPKPKNKCDKCMSDKIQLSGFKFGYGCEVIDEADKTDKNNRRWNVKCHCGNIWNSMQSHILHSDIKECRLCADKTGGLKQRGENHWHYNFELTDDERNDKRNTAEIHEWKRLVLERDNYTCVITGRQYDLVVHHLDGYHWTKDKRTDVDNGVTMHYEVHELFHHIFGKGNNTLEQFLEFKAKYNNWINQ